MKRSIPLRSFLSGMGEDSEASPFLPIAELAGDHRLLVENHSGVIYYSTDKIGIKVKYGELQICGCQLMLQHMTNIKLVISGRIDAIAIIRRRGA